MISGVDRCYEALGLWPGATYDEVRQAYRSLVQVWHPDRFTHNPELQQTAQEKLKVINESYSRLRSRKSSHDADVKRRQREAQTSSASRQYTASRQSEASAKRNKRALIIESEMESRRALREFFSRKGYQVVEAENDVEAISASVHGRPEMVFIGSSDAGRAELETIRSLKRINPEVAVIVASDTGGPRPDEQSRSEGTLHINKPINFAYLGQALRGRFEANGGIVDLTV